MRVSDKAIVLQSIRHGEKKIILRLFTENYGLLTVIGHPGRAPSSRLRMGSLMALNMLNVELSIKESREIHQLTEASAFYTNPGISGSFPRLTIAQFLNEILIKTLREQSPNKKMFGFIEGCLLYLNEAEENYSNLHLFFLAELSGFLGFEPQNNYSPEEPFFDCREGRFSALALAFPLGLNEEDSLLFSSFLKGNSLRHQLSNSQRQRLLDILVGYFQLHVPGFSELRSLEVLRELVRE